MTDAPSTKVALIEEGKADAPAKAEPLRGEVFTFGDAESVLDRRELSAYFEVWHNGRWYEPPMPMGRLAQVFNVSPYHRSAVALRVNLLVSQMVASRWLGADDFERFALDFVQMGNGYLESVPNLSGRIAAAKYTPAVHTRAGVASDTYWFVNGALGQEHQFAPGSVFHLMQPDVAQEIYGLPEWLSALQSALLSENATLFRRRYYLNGNHAGFILYINEQLFDQTTVDEISDKMRDSKGAGNFKNLLIYAPGGKKDGVQILPIGSITAHDEFTAVKGISRDDMLAAHRTPPPLIGIIPQNSGGFGKVSEALDTFYLTEIVPIIRRMLRMNDWFGVSLLAFRDWTCADGRLIRQDGTIIPASSAGSARRA